MFVLRAKYLLTNPNTLINNGVVVVSNDKILFAGRFKDLNKQEACRIIDLGNSVITPGLINAHSHLELTNLNGRINYTGSFAGWISQILNAKKGWTEDDYTLSVRSGIKKSIEAGTTTIADITRDGFSLAELRKSKLRKTVFYELIDFNPSRAEETIRDFKARFNDTYGNNLLSIGIFPHAPYTVSKDLYNQCSTVSDQLKIPIATHLSETNEEIEFLTKGTGNLATLLRDLNTLGDWNHPGLRPIAYLNQMGILKNNLMIIHCNYVTIEEIMMLKSSKSSIVYCPKSHKYFQHMIHPFRKLIDQNINIALGTDSLASNDSLSILDEMKCIYDGNKDIKPQDIFFMGTIAGAVAVGLENKIGRLEPGFDADITAIQLPNEEKSNFYEGVFSKNSECIFSVVSGSVCYDKYRLSGLPQRIKTH